MRLRWWVALFAMGALGCLQSWDVTGPYACSSDGTCPGSLACDDGVCCNPTGLPPCPTLPTPTGLCPNGDPSAAFYEDRDGDGFGNPNVRKLLCGRPLAGGWVANERDCDDNNAAINPAAHELCNGRDDNCNGQLDEGLSPRTTWYKDEDGDGFGADAVSVEACVAPPGYVALGGDCAPFDPARFPGAPELCNNIDDNCNQQVDEPPLADVQNAGDLTVRFPCLTGLPGVCGAGEFRCERPGPVSQRVCHAYTSPNTVREVCDQLDNNCDGRVDEQPACGGPPAIVRAPGATYGAFRLTNTSFLSSRCQKGVPGNVVETAASDGTWSGTQTASTGYHGWYMEAPANAPWDLSAPDVKLNLVFTATFTPTAYTGGAWGSPGSPDAYNPVVYLCGDDDSQVMRYRITQPPSAFKGNETSFNATLQLNLPTGTVWLVGIGSGFDTSRVRRIELVVQSFSPAFTITFGPGAGLSR